jgi:hypothetical protein
MPTIDELFSALEKADAAGNTEDAKALANWIRETQAQQVSAGAQMPIERPDMLVTAIEFAGRSPEEVGATLDNTPPPRELAADILKAVSPKAESITQSEVDAIYGTMARNPSIRDYFNQQVAAGNINPSTQFDAERTPVLAGLWDQYKSEMQSPAGAFKQGFVESIGPTIGGKVGEIAGTIPLVGGAVGALTGAALGYEQAGLPGAIGGAGLLGVTGAVPGLGTVQTGLIGGYLGGKIQEAVTPMSTEERARASFTEQDRASRYAKLSGEVLPEFATGFKLGAAKAVAGGAIGAGMEAVRQAQEGRLNISALAERAIQGAVAAQSRDLPDILRSRALRTEATAIKQRNEMMGVQTQNVDAAIAALERAPEITTAGFQPMAGDVTGDKGLMNLQRILTARNDALQARDQQNIQAIASELGARLAQEGASTKEINRRVASSIREYMAGKRATTQQAVDAATAESNALLNSATEASAALKTQGEQEAAAILDQALARSETIMQGATTGLLDAEQAANRVQAELDNAYRAVSSYRDSRKEAGKRAVRSEITKEVLVENLNEEKDIFDGLYRDERIAKTEAPVDNMLAAAKVFKTKEKELRRSSSNSVDAIINSYKKKKTDSLNTLKERRTEIGGEIGEAVASGNNVRAGALGAVKDAIERDMERAAEGNDLLKKINKFFFEHAQTFRDGPMGRVLRADNPVANSQTIDQFFNSKEDILQLRSALKGTPPELLKFATDFGLPARAGKAESPTAIKAVTDAMIEKMSSALGPNPRPEAIQDFLSKGKPGEATVADWAGAFPEINPLIDSLVPPIEAATERVAGARLTVEQAQAALKDAEKTAKDIVNEARSLAKNIETGAAGQGKEAVQEAKVRGKEIEDNARATAKETLKDATEKLKNSVATRFLRSQPEEEIKSIMEKNNAPQLLSELMLLAEKDKSGATTEAVQNAFRLYIKQNSTLSKQTKLGYTGAPANIEELAVSLADTIKFLTIEKNREALAAVFGKNSPELNALGVAQQKIAMMQSRLQATPGESVTAFTKGVEKKIDKQLEDTALGSLERAISGIEPGKGKLVTGVYKMLKNMWTGDTEGRVVQLLSDAMLDPEVAKLILKKVTPENLPKVNELIRSYLVAPPQPFVTPQQESQ